MGHLRVLKMLIFKIFQAAPRTSMGGLHRVVTLAGKAGKAGKWYLFQVHVWGWLEFSIVFGFSSKKNYKL